MVGSGITINGALGSANVTIAAGDSAKKVIAAINAKAGDTGVTASGKTQVDAVSFTASGSYSHGTLLRTTPPLWQ